MPDYPTTAREYLATTIAEKFEMDFDTGDRGEIREFTAIALTDGVPLSRQQQLNYGSNSLGSSTDAARISRYLVKAMIIGNANDEMLPPTENPHRYLLDPCSLETTPNVATTVKIILMYTTYITSKDFNIAGQSLIKRGDKIRVTMTVDSRDANIRTDSGEVVEIVSKASHDPFLQTVCDSLQGKFDLSKMKLLGADTTDLERKGRAGEKRNIDFSAFKLVANCKPNNQNAKNLKDYLGEDKYQKYVEALAAHEGDYDDVNRYGYSGRYQFGVGALRDGGYIKNSAWDYLGEKNCQKQPKGRCEAIVRSVLDDNSNWKNKNGVGSLNQWLSNHSAQDEALYDYTNRHFKTLKKNNKIDLDNPNDVVGMLGAYHLKGYKGARLMRDGWEQADGNGTFPTTYYIEIGGAVC